MVKSDEAVYKQNPKTTTKDKTKAIVELCSDTKLPYATAILFDPTIFL